MSGTQGPEASPHPLAAHADGPARCFRSTDHPGGTSPALVYSRRMVRPLGAVMIPVMCAALAAVLAGQRIWPHLLWATAGALSAAWLWARFQLTRTPAEAHVRAAQRRVAIRSVQDVLRKASPEWQYLIRVRPEHLPAALRLDLGHQTHRLLARRWPRLSALEGALQRALQSPEER